MFGGLKKVLSSASDKFDALVNEEEMQAVVAACVLVAAADGKIEDSEVEAAFSGIAKHESLSGFKPAKIRAVFESDLKLINADKSLAEEVLYDRVSTTIHDKIARIRVLGIAKQIAEADGIVAKEEQAVLDKIRRLTA